MSLFNVSINEKIKTDKNLLLDSLYINLLHKKEYKSSKEKNSFTIEKCKLSTILTYNTKVSIEHDELFIEGELHDTLLLTIIIILAILLTYGIGVVLVVAFAFFQKKKAQNFLNELISKLNKDTNPPFN